MSIPKINKPFIAVTVYFVIGIILSMYGVVEGTMYLFDLFMGIIIYKVICSWK